MGRNGALLFTPTPPRGVFTRLLRAKPGTAVRETAVYGFCAYVAGHGVSSNGGMTAGVHFGI